MFTEISFGRGGGQALESRVLDITAVEGKWSTFHALSQQLTWSHMIGGAESMPHMALQHVPPAMAARTVVRLRSLLCRCSAHDTSCKFRVAAWTVGCRDSLVDPAWLS